MAALRFLVAAMGAGSADVWEPLRRGAEAWASLSFDTAFAINVGDASGRLFAWETPGFSMTKTRMQGASLSKWPSAVMIAGLVADGTLGFDDRANRYLPFWSRDPKDPRSRVTLRHLLSFRSGYMKDGSAGPSCSSAQSDFMECAERLYHSLTNEGEPGTVWSYLSCHLQLAGAMAVAASGLPIDQLYAKYLYEPFNMTSTTWTPTHNPQLATGITTTADDFEQLLHRLLTFRGLPKAVQDEMEIDYSQPPCRPSGDGWFGHYAMGHWWECLGYGTPAHYERDALPADCLAAGIQAGPGMFGYYPLLDRSRGVAHGGGGSHPASVPASAMANQTSAPTRPPFYFQIALQEDVALSGIPEYLRLLAKPVADAILAGRDPESIPRAQLLAAGGGLLARDLDDIKAALGACECARAPHDRGEPYRSLGSWEYMGPDVPEITRRELSAQGQGLLLRDLVHVERRLGRCACKGRA